MSPSRFLGFPEGSLQAGMVDVALAGELADEEAAAHAEQHNQPAVGGGVGDSWDDVPAGLRDIPFEGGVT